VVNVQVGADVEIDCLRRESGRSELREEGVLAAGIDEVGLEPRSAATSAGVASAKKSTGKATTSSTTPVTRTPPTSHGIVPTLRTSVSVRRG
jgi:hypothetical protein